MKTIPTFFFTADMHVVHNYIKNNRSSCFVQSNFKGVVVFSVILHELCQAAYNLNLTVPYVQSKLSGKQNTLQQTTLRLS